MEPDYYSTPGVFTDLDRHGGVVDRITGNTREVVAGLIRHVDWAWAYAGQLPDPADGELWIRPAADIVDVILRHPGPLDRVRPPDRRMIGVCRHFATLHVALLRRRGIAARVRCGFSLYFQDDWAWDHWITEWHDGTRWVRADPQLDPVQLTHVVVDPDDLPGDRFLTAAEAWRAHRAGTIDTDRFGVPGAHGPSFIAGSVLRDLGCLNKVELLPWDVWSPNLNYRIIDDLAALDPDDTTAVREAWTNGEPGVRVPDDLTTIESRRD